MVALGLLLLPLLGSTVLAARPRKNDWAKPCFDGECFYDLPEKSATSPGGSLRIWGSPKAITDVTRSAGWIILGCEPNSLAQDIRLVCQNDESNPRGCGHLFRSKGAINKIVRLPEDCGAGPFARISGAYVAEDQRIPASIQGQLVRRSGEPAIVRGLTLDTDFSQIDVLETGEVEMELEGANVPGEEGDALPDSPSARALNSRIVQDRGLFDWIENAFNKWNNWDKTITKNLTPLNVDKSYNLFDLSISCPANGGYLAYYATLKADLYGKAYTTIVVGAAAKGTIIPPKIKEFGVFANLNGFVNGKFVLTGTASGTVDTGLKTILEIGIPGFSFPGILTIGPSFKIQGQAKATLDIDVNLTVDVAYTLTDAKLFWPKSANNPSGGGFNPGTNELKLSINPSFASRATVEAHFLPRIDLGISAFAGLVKATVFLNLDASADASLTFNAGGSAGTTTLLSLPIRTLNPTLITAVPTLVTAVPTLITGPIATATLTPISSLSITRIPTLIADPPLATLNPSRSLIPISPREEELVVRDGELESRADWYVNGCVDINARLSINAGADASFFGLFDASTSVSLVNKKWDIYDKCWGTTAKRSEIPDLLAERSLHYLTPRGLGCQASNSQTLVSLI